ncbi:WD40/YVTN/BNR-like repeat-containing protein [Halopseudomonas maritima]|uniref:WD40/YVTN/BNR-like repeat-containing protein n=1 Tax=Halopseudomonas maritima TaxID=2918528 RepID=UPI001EEC1419|nr:YCF48-related protein [Halopseudomonas maritima]UJJ31484.1 glycosyl hydrolase [Halopseudomonas maritima]
MNPIPLLLAAALALTPFAAGALEPVPAVPSKIASEATMLAATRAGERIVAVGDHGVVLLSDDNGAGFRQAGAVPLSSPLTAVSFINAQTGWAVGHWGSILLSEDGGENWRIQRLTPHDDRPLFAVHFFDQRDGVAVGLWSQVLITRDGGRSWQEQSLPPPPGARRADLNLMSLFTDAQGRLYAAAESGKVLRSADRGLTWRYLDTGYSGSFWTGAVLADGRLLVGGQRGTLMRGSADGQAWQTVELGSKSSITGIAVRGNRVDVIGLDGLLARSLDGGRSFQLDTRADGIGLTALQADGAGLLLFSRRGVLPRSEISTAASVP